MAQAPLGDASVASPGGAGMYSGASALAAENSFDKSQDALYTLAADTGGKALLNYNDLSYGLVQAQQAVVSYYLIGYYSTNQALDGRFRRIKIALKEGMVAGLDYRRGYYAGKEFSRFTSFDKERQLEEAMLLGNPITDLTLQAEVDYFQLNRAEYFVPVSLNLPGSELALAHRRGAQHVVIDFIGELKNGLGWTIRNVRDKVDIKLNDQTIEQLSKRPIQYDTGFTLLPGPHSLKILARDDVTGNIGTYLAKFVVPNLNEETKRVPISSVVLSGQTIFLKDALFSTGDPRARAFSPLVTQGRELIPSVTKVFRTGQEMNIYFEAYERTGAVTPLSAFVTFYRGATRALETPPVLVSDVVNEHSRALPFRFSLPLSGLKPGRYTVQITVVDPSLGRTAFRRTPVLLVP